MNIQEIAVKVSPSVEERKKMNKIHTKIGIELRALVKKYMLIDNFAFAGSFAKDTWIAHHKEFDVFLVFSRKASIKQLEKQGLECGKKLAKALGGKQNLVYASHPYSLINFGEFSLDLVPCYGINNNEKIISAVDRSLLHVEFVKKAIKRNPKYATEIRLLKQFLKRFNLYGADDVFQGFSGYLVELLVIFYKSFEKTLENAAKWKQGTFIDFNIRRTFIDFNIKRENKKKNESSAILEENSAIQEEKLRNLKHNLLEKSSLVVIDPTNENRNVAANLSLDVFDKFVLYSNLYLASSQHKKEAFFFKKERASEFKRITFAKNLKEIIKQRGTSWVFLRIKFPKESLQLNVTPKVRRLLKCLEANIMSFDFNCLTSWFFVEEKQAILAFEFPSTTLGFFERKIGPQLYNQEHLRIFLNQHKDAMRFFTQNNRICAEEARAHPDAVAVIASLLQKKKVENIEFVKGARLSEECKGALVEFLSDKFEGLKG